MKEYKIATLTNSASPVAMDIYYSGSDVKATMGTKTANLGQAINLDDARKLVYKLKTGNTEIVWEEFDLDRRQRESGTPIFIDTHK